MSNSNDKPPLDLTESLTISDNAQAPSTTSPTVNKVDCVELQVEMSSVKPREKNDSLGVPAINQPDVTTGNLSHSDEASTSNPIIDHITEVNRTPYYVDKSDDVTIGFLLYCAERGKNRGNQHPFICKVPRILRDLSESSYTPQLVSIGPIHREDPTLQEFEWLKECYLNDLLNRCDSAPKEILEACLQKVKKKIHQIRQSYAGVKKNYSDVELARMMVMDGCFILEFCFKQDAKKDFDLPDVMRNGCIAMDLMLLENQVPFFVLHTLFDCLDLKESVRTLSQVLDTGFESYINLFRVFHEKHSFLSNVLNKYLAPYIKRFCSLLLGKISTTNVGSDEQISTTHGDSDSTHAHVLGFLHKRYQLVVAKSSPEDTAFHSIVELDRSGMNFKRHQENKWSMTIKFQSSLFACLPLFWSKPTLLMPTLVINDSTELILRNFIAYEQSFHQDHRYYFTSYAVAMDILINTQEDIAKLVESKVLVNDLGSNQEAADMINKICKNIVFTDFYYNEDFIQMDRYYNRFWPKHIARLRRVYFSNPWSIIALVAAIILFSLTVVQTIYTVVQTVYTIRAA
ncbi:hypothetical protein CTI12_AA493090 [Artemisia annua]|uniref:Uncharacterized protein n=1 Tax=Artemisia annua TaxID=35608 RepID=A0A2U1LGJ0_ARTAN|nr:hypothetical protein CTI12_AA493090 [Artemisia annua]